IIDNAGVIGAAGLAFSIHSDALSNRGAITGAEALFAVGRFDNTGGTVSAGRLGLWTDQLTNGDGSITSAGRAILSVRDSFDNRNGRLVADGALAVLDSGSLSLMNAGGEIRGDGVLIDATHTDSAGLVRSEASFTLYTQDDLSLGPDDLLFESAEHARLQVGGHFANEATVHADQSLSVEAGSLENTGHLGSDGITVLRIDGALVNHGEITGQTLSVSAGSLDNDGEVRARDLELMLRGDAAQLAGRIEASGRADFDLAGNLDLRGGSIHGDTVDLTVGGDVSILAHTRTRTDTTLSRDFDAGTVTTTETRVQYAESPPTLSATGELRLRAGGNFSVRGATIGAGGDFDGLVGGAVDVTALTLASRHTGTTYGRYRYDEPGSRERQLDTTDALTARASELTAGGNLSLIAGGDARYQGSLLAAGETLTLGAVGGALEFSALALTDTRSLVADRLDGLTDVSEYHQRQHGAATALTAEQLMLVAGSTLTVSGAELSAGGDITALAGGDIIVASLSLTETSQRSGMRSAWVDVGDGGYLTRYRDEYDSGPRERQHGGRFVAGGDITLAAGLDTPFGDDLLTRFGLAGAPTRDTPGVLRADAVTLTAAGDVGLSGVDGLAAADSTIEAGASLGLESGGDLVLASVTLAAEADLTAQAAGHLIIEGGRHSRQPLALQRDAAESGVEAADPLAAFDAPRAREHTDPAHADRFARTGEGRFSAGGRLTLAAGGALFSSGSDYAATEFIAVAGGDLSIVGSRTIEEATTRNGRERHTRIQAVAARIDADTVTIQGVGREIEVEDGDAETTTTASTVHLDHVAIQSRGTTHISATGDIAITPGAEFEHDYRRRKSSGLLSKRVRIDERTVLRAATSSIDVGSLELEALGDVSFTATRIAIRGERTEGDQAGRPTESRIVAGGDVRYAAVHDQEHRTHFDKKSLSIAGIRLSERATEITHEQLVALPTVLQSEADVLSESGGDTTLAGTRIDLGENVMTLTVGGTLRLEAVYDLERTQEVERSFTLGGIDGFDPKLGKNTEDTTIDEHSGARATQIDAGTVDSETGGDLVLAGADIRADDNLDLAVGGDIVQQDAASTSHHFAEQRTSYLGSFVNTSDGRVHDFGVSTQRSKD
ncbi:MAG: hemagglutinin repeat-containing protein, partial [Rhodocyclaceae bacterium]|nr:hemagglutinin repeat-containing protein [Rhodocyclaceae bacterium]